MSRLAVVAHDAGGAELVGHYVQRLGEPVLAALDGPAVKVFERLSVAADRVSVDDAVDGASWVLCGTSWQSDLEWRAMRRARAAGTRVVAFVDHWSEYADRFVRHGETVRPDEVWVTDEAAHDLAVPIFEGTPVVVAGNPHLDALEAEARTRGVVACSRERAKHVLMVTELTSAHAQARYGDPRYFGYTELEAARYFVEHADAVLPSIERITLRPHPAEPVGKYDWVAGVSRWPVTVDANASLLDHLLSAEAVAGCNTMAMVAAMRLGRPVVCYIPPGGPPCLLPHPDIVMLRDAGSVSGVSA